TRCRAPRSRARYAARLRFRSASTTRSPTCASSTRCSGRKGPSAGNQYSSTMGATVLDVARCSVDLKACPQQSACRDNIHRPIKLSQNQGGVVTKEQDGAKFVRYFG